jgi:hypothetical protein
MRWYVRIPLKWLLFGLVFLAVLYPDPRLFVRHVQRIRNLDALIDDRDPDLRAWVTEFERRRATATQPTTQPWQVQRAVEAFVYEKVPYQWDWILYGVSDYIPTVPEMFDLARRRPDEKVHEDCDGRAVMCASMLRAMGFDSRIVTDLQHVWVVTPQGALMGPGMQPALQSSRTGNQTSVGTALGNVPTALSFGVSVFPLQREIIIWAAAVLLSLHRRMSWKAALLGAVLSLQGLLFVRAGVISKPDFRWLSQFWPAIIGIAHIAAGLAVLWIASYRARRRATLEPR